MCQLIGQSQKRPKLADPVFVSLGNEEKEDLEPVRIGSALALGASPTSAWGLAADSRVKDTQSFEEMEEIP